MTFDQLVDVLRPLEGQRVRLTYAARGTANYEPQRSGILTFWNPRGRDDVNDPQIDGHGGFFYADGCITRVEVMGANGRYAVPSCPRCGQTGHMDVCDQCRKLDREPQGEAMRLFSPAPNQLAGQMSL